MRSVRGLVLHPADGGVGIATYFVHNAYGAVFSQSAPGLHRLALKNGYSSDLWVTLSVAARSTSGGSEPLRFRLGCSARSSGHVVPLRTVSTVVNSDEARPRPDVEDSTRLWHSCGQRKASDPPAVLLSNGTAAVGLDAHSVAVLAELVKQRKYESNMWISSPAWRRYFEWRAPSASRGVPASDPVAIVLSTTTTVYNASVFQDPGAIERVPSLLVGDAVAMLPVSAVDAANGWLAARGARHGLFVTPHDVARLGLVLKPGELPFYPPRVSALRNPRARLLYNAAVLARGGLCEALARFPERAHANGDPEAQSFLQVHRELVSGAALPGAYQAAAIIANLQAPPKHRSTVWLTDEDVREQCWEVVPYAPAIELVGGFRPSATDLELALPTTLFCMEQFVDQQPLYRCLAAPSSAFSQRDSSTAS